jgi:hypothetical protein
MNLKEKAADHQMCSSGVSANRRHLLVFQYSKAEQGQLTPHSSYWCYCCCYTVIWHEGVTTMSGIRVAGVGGNIPGTIQELWNETQPDSADVTCVWACDRLQAGSVYSIFYVVSSTESNAESGNRDCHRVHRDRSGLSLLELVFVIINGACTARNMRNMLCDSPGLTMVTL